MFKQLAGVPYHFISTLSPDATSGLTIPMDGAQHVIFNQPINGVFLSLYLQLSGSLDCADTAFRLTDGATSLGVTLTSTLRLFSYFKHGDYNGAPAITRFDDVSKIYEMNWGSSDGTAAEGATLSITPPKPALDSTVNTMQVNYALFWADFKSLLRQYYPNNLAATLNTTNSLLAQIANRQAAGSPNTGRSPLGFLNSTEAID